MAMLQGGLIQDMLGMPGFSPYDPYGALKNGVMSRAMEGPQEGLQDPPGAPQMGDGSAPGPQAPPEEPQSLMGPMKGAALELVDQYRQLRDSRMPGKGAYFADALFQGEGAELGRALFGVQDPRAMAQAARDSAAANLILQGVSPQEAMLIAAQAGDPLDMGTYVRAQEADIHGRRLGMDMLRGTPEYERDVARAKMAPIAVQNADGTTTYMEMGPNGMQPVGVGGGPEGNQFGESYAAKDERELERGARERFEKGYEEAVTDNRDARRILTQFDEIVSLLPKEGGGAGALDFELIADKARNLGIDLPQEIFIRRDERALRERLNSVIASWVSAYRPVGGGTISDADMALYRQRVPDGNWTGAANRAVLNDTIDKFNQNDEYWDMKRNWVDQGGKVSSFDSKYRSWKEKEGAAGPIEPRSR